MTDAKLDKIHLETEHVIEIMRENINKAITRGDNLTEIEERATQLNDQSQLFHSKTKELKRVMCWRHYRFYILVLVLLAIFIVIFIMIGCGVKMQC